MKTFQVQKLETIENSYSQKGDCKLFDSASSIPSEVALSELIGAIEAIGEFRRPIKFSIAYQEFGRRSPNFVAILCAAQRLGLLTRLGMYFDLTDAGLGFLKAPRARNSILRVRLSQIEPFKTAVELLREKGSVSSMEVFKRLSNNGRLTEGYTQSEIHKLLIEWALETGLMNYSSRSAKFSSSLRSS